MIRFVKEKIHAFFTKGHERTILTKKNIAASFTIKGITIFISLAVVPLTINYVNPVRYGIWITLSSMVAWMALFDIGFGNGLKNKFAEAKAKGEIFLAKKYVSSTYAVMCLLWAIIFIIFACINPFLDWAKILKSVPAEYVGELSSLIWICIISFGFIFVLRLLTSIVMADQRPAISSFIDMLGQLLSFIGIFILVKTTPASLSKLAAVVGFAPVIIYFAASIFLFNGKYKAFRPSFKCVDFKLAKQMMNLGVKFFIASCAAFIISQTLNFLILYLTNPEEVSNFNTAFKIFSVILNIMGIIIIPYWTSFTDAYTLKDFSWMKNSVSKLRKLFLYSLAVQLLILVFSDFIYRVWIKDALDISFYMSLSVFLYITTLCWLNINIYPLNGIGKIQLQLYSSIIEMILLFPMAFWMGNHFGAIGIVLSPVIVYIPRMIWAPIQLNKLINQTATGIWNK